jgi:hypothetical protein
MTLAERRREEVDRQKKRNKKDLLKVTGYIIMLILYAAVLAGFADFAAGGW